MGTQHENRLIVSEPQQDFKLQPAAVDWRTRKTQVTGAAAIAVVAMLAVHYFGTLSWGLALDCFNAVLVALITTEITGRYGNRLSGAASIWAAILFAASMKTALVQNFGIETAILPLYLISIFCYLRYRGTKEKLLLRGALLSSMLGLLTSVVSATVPVIVLAAEMLLPVSAEAPATGKRNQSGRWIAVMLFFLALAFVGTVGRLAPDMVPMLNQPQLPAYDDSNLHPLLIPTSSLAIAGYIGALLCGIAGGSARVAIFCFIWMLAVSTNSHLLQVPFCIMLSTLALPVTRAVPKRIATAVTFIGLIALTLCVFGRLQ